LPVEINNLGCRVVSSSSLLITAIVSGIFFVARGSFIHFPSNFSAELVVLSSPHLGIFFNKCWFFLSGLLESRVVNSW